MEPSDPDLAELHLAGRCDEGSRLEMVPLDAEVSVRLNAAGRVVRATLPESAGDPCRDAVVLSIVRSVVYHWIPNPRFPAPVELEQPMRIVAAEW